MNRIIGVLSWKAVCRPMLALVAAGHEADAGLARQLALRLGHESRAAFLPAGNEADLLAVFMKAVQHGQIAFARHTEHGVDALCDQCLHQRMAGQARRSGRCLGRIFDSHPATVPRAPAISGHSDGGFAACQGGRTHFRSHADA
jgi:hypothetical protein